MGVRVGTWVRRAEMNELRAENKQLKAALMQAHASGVRVNLSMLYKDSGVLLWYRGLTFTSTECTVSVIVLML